MIIMRLTSNYGFIRNSLFYVGWSHYQSEDEEQFGFSIGNLYVGVYNHKWFVGILNQNGVLYN
jgi:hypothetical protein